MANTLNTAIAASQTTSSGAAASKSPSSNDRLATKDTFLQLMVAQLRYQNPLNPVDGSSFLAQLSQISSVEQMVQMSQTLDQIKTILSNGGSGSGVATQTSSQDSKQV